MNELDKRRSLDSKRAELSQTAAELRESRLKLEKAMRDRRIATLAKAFPSEELRAAADAALQRELESSVSGDLPCDECLPAARKA